jgi:branched-chain amino acid transport system ATP-binding protein
MLQVKDLDVAYGKVSVVHGVCFNAPSGKTVSLIGANGAGKSTTLLAIAGILKPLSGEIFLEGRPIQNMNPNQRVKLGMCLVPEGRHLFNRLTTVENLRIGYASGREHSYSFKQMVERLFDIFPLLATRRRLKAGSLSGGEQQMLAIARALASEPRLLMVDELSLGLAPVIVEQLFEVLRQFVHKESLTVVLVEQYVKHALELADYAYVLHKGRVVAEGRPEELLNGGTLVTSYLGS